MKIKELLSRDAATSLTKLTEALATAAEPHWPEQAEREYQAGNLKRALAICDEQSSKGNSSTTFPLAGLIVKGKCLLAQGELSAASDEFHSLLQREPNNPGALKALGDIHYARGTVEVALSYYENVANSSAGADLLRCSLNDELARGLKRCYDQLPTVTLTADSSPENSLGLTEITVNAKDAIATEEAEPKSIPVEPAAVEAPASEMNVTTEKSGESSAVTFRRPPEIPKLSEPALAEPTPTPTPTTTPRFDCPEFNSHYRTETMADLLLKQGRRKAALEIIEELIAKNSESQSLSRLREKLQREQNINPPKR